MPDLLLLSGGLDSTALAAWCRPARCLTVDYGQRAAAAEIAASVEVCRALGLPHEVLEVPVHNLGTGTMAGAPASQASPHNEFWPFRNQLLLTLAAMYAMRHNFSRVLIGTVISDRRHVDGSVEFLRGVGQLVKIQEGGIEIAAPAIAHTTIELIALSNVSPAVLGWSHSCHAGGVACGVCPGCHKHSDVLDALGWHQ